MFKKSLVLFFELNFTIINFWKLTIHGKTIKLIHISIDKPQPTATMLNNVRFFKWSGCVVLRSGEAVVFVPQKIISTGVDLALRIMFEDFLFLLFFRVRVKNSKFSKGSNMVNYGTNQKPFKSLLEKTYFYFD